MGFEVYVGGVAELDRVRRALRSVDDKAMRRKLERGLRKALDPVAKDVRAEAGRVMPSGYAPVLSKSLRFRQSTKSRTGFTQVTLRVFGDGQKERRDVPALNKGVLRHPVFGRTRRIKRHAKYRATSMANPWAAQTIKPGFVDRPVDQVRGRVAKEMDAVVDEIAAQITKG